MNIKSALPNAVKSALAAVTHRRPSRYDVIRAELAYLSAAATRCLDRRLAGLPLLKADEAPPRTTSCPAGPPSAQSSKSLADQRARHSSPLFSLRGARTSRGGRPNSVPISRASNC